MQAGTSVQEMACCQIKDWKELCLSGLSILSSGLCYYQNERPLQRAKQVAAKGQRESPLPPALPQADQGLEAAPAQAAPWGFPGT